MATLKEIRKRINSVKNTQKITKAMKMVAAARLRRAQQRMLQLRPYADRTHEMLEAVAARVDVAAAQHPLLQRRPIKRVRMVVLTSDRGLAGAFNAAVLRKTAERTQSLQAEGKQVSFTVIGRKGRDDLRRRGATIVHDFGDIYHDIRAETVRPAAQSLAAAYAEGEVDAIEVVYIHFKSAISQELRVETLLPLPSAKLKDSALPGDFIYEPSQEVVLAQLLPMYVHVELTRAVFESVASEHGARMTAMDAATRNAADMIGRLTLQFNRARQAAITKELMEIISGAEAVS